MSPFMSRLHLPPRIPARIPARIPTLSFIAPRLHSRSFITYPLLTWDGSGIFVSATATGPSDSEPSSLDDSDLTDGIASVPLSSIDLGSGSVPSNGFESAHFPFTGPVKSAGDESILSSSGSTIPSDGFDQLSDATQASSPLPDKVTDPYQDLKEFMLAILSKQDERLLAIEKRQDERFEALERRQDEMLSLLRSPMEDYNSRLTVVAEKNIEYKLKLIRKMFGRVWNEDMENYAATELADKDQMKKDMFELVSMVESLVSKFCVNTVQSGSSEVDFSTCSSLLEVVDMVKNTILKLGLKRALIVMSPQLFQTALMMLPNGLSELATTVFGLLPTILGDMVSSYTDALKDGDKDSDRIVGYQLAAIFCVIVLGVCLVGATGGKYVPFITTTVLVLWGLILGLGNVLKVRNVKPSSLT